MRERDTMMNNLTFKRTQKRERDNVVVIWITQRTDGRKLSEREGGGGYAVGRDIILPVDQMLMCLSLCVCSGQGLLIRTFSGRHMHNSRAFQGLPSLSLSSARLPASYRLNPFSVPRIAECSADVWRRAYFYTFQGLGETCIGRVGARGAV